jgi:hypothetical protein
MCLACQAALFTRSQPQHPRLGTASSLRIVNTVGLTSNRFLHKSVRKQYLFPLYSEVRSAVSSSTILLQTGHFAIFLSPILIPCPHVISSPRQVEDHSPKEKRGRVGVNCDAEQTYSLLIFVNNVDYSSTPTSRLNFSGSASNISLC